MDEIINQVVQRTGISEDKARQAVEVVVSQLEQRLPGPVASQLRSHIGGGGGAAAAGEGSGGLADMAKGIGGSFKK